MKSELDSWSCASMNAPKPSSDEESDPSSFLVVRRRLWESGFECKSGRGGLEARGLWDRFWAPGGRCRAILGTRCVVLGWWLWVWVWLG